MPQPSPKPTVSVVVCTCNGERYLRPQLDTLLAQTYPLLEILVQDDHSTDATPQIVREYAARDTRIRFFANDGPQGINANFLSALRRARGELIAVCDQDDLWHPQKVERQVAAIGAAPLCTCRSAAFLPDGSTLPDDPRTPNLQLPRLMFRSIPGHTMLLRRSLIDRLPADGMFYAVSLYDVWLALAAAITGGVALADEPLVRFRRHEGASTLALSAAQQDVLPQTGAGRPSAADAWRQLLWSVRHYADLRPWIDQMFRSRLDFLKALDADTAQCADAMKLCRLQLQRGPLAYLRLTAYFVRHRRTLFHTVGSGPATLLRALLYPVMQVWNFRGWLNTRR